MYLKQNETVFVCTCLVICAVWKCHDYCNELRYHLIVLLILLFATNVRLSSPFHDRQCMAPTCLSYIICSKNYFLYIPTPCTSSDNTFQLFKAVMTFCFLIDRRREWGIIFPTPANFKITTSLGNQSA